MSLAASELGSVSMLGEVYAILVFGLLSLVPCVIVVSVMAAKLRGF